MQIDDAEYHRVRGAVRSDLRQRAGDDRNLGAGAHDVVAEHKVTGLQRIDEVRAPGNIETDRLVEARAQDSSLQVGHRDRLDPSDRLGDLLQVFIAGRIGEAEGGARAG